MKQVLIYSIRPQWLLKILNGNKTIEVSKRDLPQWAKDKLAKGEDVWGYGYCTKGKPYLHKIRNWRDEESLYAEYQIGNCNDTKWSDILNGLVVFKFQVSGVTLFEFIDGNLMVKYDNEAQLLGKVHMLNEQATQLTYEQLFKYIGNNNGYAHHFTNIQPIEPMGLSEFYGDFAYSDTDEYGRQHSPIHLPIPLKRPPQSFMTAWVKGE